MTASADLSYRTAEYTRSLAAADYIDRFRDAGRFIESCRACPNYGCSWGCPPFDFDVEARLRRYRRLLLVATRITPTVQALPMELSRPLIRPERIRLERRLHELARQYDGLSCAYVGSCLYCPGGTCTRPDGKPCRHPELVRPSLEAYGFDIGRTLSELFGLELAWGRDGRMPATLTLVCGLFHNGPDDLGWSR